MAKILVWLHSNWYWVSGTLFLLISILNAATKHWSNYGGVVKVLMFTIDALSIIRSKGDSGVLLGNAKVPLIPTKNQNGKEAVTAKKPEPTASDKPTSLGGGVTTILLLFSLGAAALVSACGAEGALIKIQTGTTALRQEGTTYFDNQCGAIALQCPKGPAENCILWVKCKNTRRTFYAGTNGIQLLVAAGLNLVGVNDQKGAKNILLQVTTAVVELHQKLEAMQVYEAAVNAAKLFGSK